MDPDEALHQLRRALAKWRSKKIEYSKTAPTASGRDEALEVAEDIATYAEALDGWLGNGGFHPVAWKARSQKPKS